MFHLTFLILVSASSPLDRRLPSDTAGLLMLTLDLSCCNPSCMQFWRTGIHMLLKGHSALYLLGFSCSTGQTTNCVVTLAYSGRPCSNWRSTRLQRNPSRRPWDVGTSRTLTSGLASAMLRSETKVSQCNCGDMRYGTAAVKCESLLLNKITYCTCFQSGLQMGTLLARMVKLLWRRSQLLQPLLWKLPPMLLQDQLQKVFAMLLLRPPTSLIQNPRHLPRR
jgi:hypothetical protein